MTREPIECTEPNFSFNSFCRRLLFLLFFLGLAYEVINISSGSGSGDSETESDRQLIRTLLERRRQSDTLLERRRNLGQESQSVSTRMSATSAMSDDSNAERDHEYDAEASDAEASYAEASLAEASDNFKTEAEIVFTPETESDPEPRIGNEAVSRGTASRFESGAQASTSAPSNKDILDNGVVCPYAHYFSGSTEEYVAFCQEYHIPNDVLLHRVRSDQIKAEREDKPEHITVPLMAITEAGLRFPFHPFLREVLWKFSLCPHQLAINSYRIIMSVIKLIEMHGIDFKATDLFWTYTMSRHAKSKRRFLSTRAHKTSLIDGLSDSDKWANLFLEVRGNFEFGGPNRNYPIPKYVDNRG